MMPDTKLRLCISWWVLICNIAWAQNSPLTVYVIGESGYNHSSAQLFELFQNEIRQAPKHSLVLFMGDNVYPAGLPGKTNPGRENAEKLITNQLQIIEDFEGLSVMIPGERDWDDGGRDGWKKVVHLNRFIDSLKGFNINFLPPNGCPGPEAIAISEKIMLVVLDIQWLLHPYNKPGIDSDCLSKEPADLLFHLRDILEKNQDKVILVASHHPVVSYGPHGTRMVGGLQDLSNPRYKAVAAQFAHEMGKYPNIIHLASHDPSLQLIESQNSYYLVSGAANNAEKKISNSNLALYVSDQQGMAKITVEDNKLTVTFLEAKDGRLMETYTADLPLSPQKQASAETGIDFSNKTVTVHASDRYKKNSGSYWLIGENYRDVWQADIEVPVFDIGTKKGGLKIIKRGGGFQTNSLRLEAADGRQYVLRSIDKYPERAAIPEILLETFAADLIKDQISAAHPYGAFVVPELADAAGVYHTNPELVWVPDDPRFGEYRKDFANGLYLFEERPDDEYWQNYESFGKPDDIKSTSKLLEKLHDDNDNFVDQQWVVKSRLFDVWLGDWDRHDDQWRWAEFDQDKGNMYRPIPRDRDQVFFVNQGFLMSIVKKKWAEPKFQGFDHDIKYPGGFIYNARHFDRSFLNELSKEDWLNTAEDLQKRLTDEVIENAIRKWPEPVFELSGQEVIEKLKSQRTNLKKYALDIYLFLAREVTITGSNKHEYFFVERLDNENTRVRVYKKTKDSQQEKLLYDRTFKTSETREIRLFGLEGEDIFEVKGEVNRGPRIRIIGGEEEDLIKAQSKVAGLAKKTKIYDTKKGNQLHLGPEAKNLTSTKPSVNHYQRNTFEYNKLAPLIIGNVNADDGLFLGGGFFYRNHGFRKKPYQSEHITLGSVALATGSWQFNYKGKYIDAIGSLDLWVDLDAKAPNFTTNFFGFGNESIFNQNAEDIFNVEDAIDYYRTRYKDFGLELLLNVNLSENANLAYGLKSRAFEAESDYNGEDRFILDNATIISDQNIFDWTAYGGFLMRFEWDKRDKKNLPGRGFHFTSQVRLSTGLNDRSDENGQINASLAYYIPLFPQTLILATNVSGGHTFGDFEFYQAQVLDGNTELRGFRKTRFYGDSKFFNNTELRLRLFHFKNRVAPASVGINLFNDIGRVWFNGENSSKWHHGFGGGFWIAPLNLVVVGVDIGHSEEETLGYLRLGFLF